MEILQQIFDSLIPAGVGGLVGWFTHRQKHRAEVKGVEADSNNKIIELYKRALDDLDKRYEERFSDLQKEIDSLRKNVELWKNKYRDLKKAFDDYREKRENSKITPGDGK